MGKYSDLDEYDDYDEIEDETGEIQEIGLINIPPMNKQVIQPQAATRNNSGSNGVRRSADNGRINRPSGSGATGRPAGNGGTGARRPSGSGVTGRPSGSGGTGARRPSGSGATGRPSGNGGTGARRPAGSGATGRPSGSGGTGARRPAGSGANSSGKASVANNRRKKKNSNKRRNLIAVIVALVIILGIGGLILWNSYSGRVYKKCVIEAGTPLVAEDFLKDKAKDKGVKVRFTTDTKEVDIYTPGTYDVKLKSGMFIYKCKVVVQDTVAPVGETQTLYIEYGEKATPEQFFTSITDMTNVTVSYDSEPNYDNYGEQQVTLYLTDAAGNKTTYTEKLVTRATRKEVAVEVGGEFPGIEEFLIQPQDSASFVTDVSTIDMSVVAKHDVDINVNGMVYTTVFSVADTVAPVVECINIQKYLTDTVTANDFIVSIEDITETTVEFATEPDMTKVGGQTVSIKVTDTSGNETIVTPSLTLMADTEAPVLNNLNDFTVFVGDTVSYKSQVKVTDNCDAEVDLKVDSSKVDLNTPGSYQVTYTATDKAGNSATKTVTLTVVARTYSIETVYALADDVLSRIITDGMSQRDKLTAIYNWTRSHVGYIDHTDKDDWVKAAYEGFVNGQGDCFCYASVTQALLTRAGITNMMIKRIPTDYNHYWNLVDIGEGWYHFDTTPRRGGPNFNYVTDAYILDYSAQHDNCHNYDKSQYPTIQ